MKTSNNGNIAKVDIHTQCYELAKTLECSSNLRFTGHVTIPALTTKVCSGCALHQIVLNYSHVLWDIITHPRSTFKAGLTHLCGFNYLSMA